MLALSRASRLDGPVMSGRHQRMLITWSACLFALFVSPVHAQELLSRMFSDHMVMQRDMPVPVWGRTAPGEAVTVSIDRQVKTAKADDTGKWMVRLDPMATGAPRKMIVRTRSDAIEISDILLGEVWLASGQSNMALTMQQARNSREELAAANLPNIRLFNIPTDVSAKLLREQLPATNPQTPNMNRWLPVSAANAADFSAVGFFFARELNRTLNVPVGIIANAVGNSQIESWISYQGLATDPGFKSVADYYDGLANYIENTAQGKRELADEIAKFNAKQAELKATGKPMMWPPVYVDPLHGPEFAGTFFNALVAPVIPFAIRGVIWYQGEAQWQRMYEYRGALPLLIRDWRARWAQGAFPFLYVQLPNWSQPRSQPDGEGWALIREAQLLALQVPNTGMAVTIDIGEADNIHPTNKQDVGYRLAVAARAAAYGENVTSSGPLYRAMAIEGSVIRLSFTQTGSGLMVGKKNGLAPAAEVPNGKLQRFAIAGTDMKFVWANAVIDRDSVLVSAPSIGKPVAVRYAWENNPDGSNLYNKEGLPASPFRTDKSDFPSGDTFFKARLEKGFSLRLKD